MSDREICAFLLKITTVCIACGIILGHTPLGEWAGLILITAIAAWFGSLMTIAAIQGVSAVVPGDRGDD